jgi:16S rRNA C967 or C1407 C5-methylase (RsmB/RsmF family)
MQITQDANLVSFASQVQRHHSVLDLCASPGSKTSQALEMLHQPNPDSINLDSPEREPSRGFVVANELVPLRAYVLAARCGALGAACRRLVVTSHRAQIFPRSIGSDGYDRIICDVPCSGDGTFRKYRDKWGHWEAHLGRQLHSLQLQIAVRAASLLKRGGVMAYSTCSMNPLEDEAVVAALLKVYSQCLLSYLHVQYILSACHPIGACHPAILNCTRSVSVHHLSGGVSILSVRTVFPLSIQAL